MKVSDILLSIKGILGDSQIADVKSGIEIIDWFHSFNHPTGGAVSSGDASSGRTAHEPFAFTKHVDSSTPDLLRYMWEGKTLPTMVFHFFTNRVKSLEIILEHPKIAYLDQMGTTAITPVEEYHIVYSKIIYSPVKINVFGQVEGHKTTQHDLQTQKVE